MNVELPTGIAELALNECWAALRNADIGRLAVVVDGQPEIYPLNFIVDHSTVVFRTTPGSKLTALVAGAPVAFEADGYDAAAGTAWSVVVKGQPKHIRNVFELFDAHSLPLFPWHASPKPDFVRIVPTSVTGRRFKVVDSSAWADFNNKPRSAPE